MASWLAAKAFALEAIEASVTCKKMNVSNIIISFLHLIIISC